MVDGNKRTIPHRNEDLDQSDLLKGVEQELKELRERMDSPPTFLKSMGVPSNDMGLAMNDNTLIGEFRNEVQSNSAFDQTMKEVVTRLAELEDNMPEFKGTTSWDVPIPFLKKDALLSDVISTVNKLIQRTTRQDRVK